MPGTSPASPASGGAVARVVTGGQAGADRAATDVAVALGVPYGGWVPRGGWAEDRPHPPGVLADYPAFDESESSDPEERTVRNVRSADATLVFVLGDAGSPGTALTASAARARGVPFALVDLTAPDRDARLESFVGGLPHRCTLNVAGPRESEQPGIYEEVTTFLLAHRHLLFGR
ncbi:MAG TPA: putative molybdenum carrier protein [Acidimicrobiales bacterium]|nr:putative molybdenum carrier protein [Acidimicrobiales bacterium]